MKEFAYDYESKTRGKNNPISVPIYRSISTMKMINWKKILKQLKLDHIKATAPGFFELSGGYRMHVKPYTDQTANGLTKCISDFITHQGGYCNRISTTGTMRKINGEMKWTKGNSNKGAADLRILFQGKSMDIEIKIGKDRMSDAQLKEMAKITRAGGLYFIANDFPSFLTWWQSIGFVIPVSDKAII